MGIFDFLFKPGTPEMKPTDAKALPDYLQKAGANMVGAAMDVAGEDYIPYTDPRIAQFNKAQQDAMTQGIGMSGISTLQGQQAYNTATGAAGGPSQAQITGYMNPYMTQVADVAAQKMRDESAIQQQKLAASAAQSGGLNSTRYAIQDAERQKNLTTGIGDLYAKAQAEAYKQGVDTSKFGLEQQLKGAVGMGTLAQQQQNLGFGDVQNQLGIGQLAQGQNQQALDIAYQNFQEQRHHPKDQLNFLAGIMNLDPNKNAITQSSMVSQPSFFESALGFGASAANTAASLGWKPFG
jgi:hypothetical protein